MPNTVWEDGPLDPVAVGPLGSPAVVAGAQGLAQAIKGFRLLRRWRWGCRRGRGDRDGEARAWHRSRVHREARRRHGPEGEGGPWRAAKVWSCRHRLRVSLCVLPGSDHGISLLHGYRGTSEVGRAYSHPTFMSRPTTTDDVDMHAWVTPCCPAGGVSIPRDALHPENPSCNPRTVHTCGLSCQYGKAVKKCLWGHREFGA